MLRIAVPFGDGFIVRLILENTKLSSYDGGFDDSMISRSDGGSSISRTDEKSTLPSCTVSNKNSQGQSTSSSFSVVSPILEYKFTFSACDIVSFNFWRVWFTEEFFRVTAILALRATQTFPQRNGGVCFELAVITNEPAPTSQISEGVTVTLNLNIPCQIEATIRVKDGSLEFAVSTDPSDIKTTVKWKRRLYRARDSRHRIPRVYMCVLRITVASLHQTPYNASHRRIRSRRIRTL